MEAFWSLAFLQLLELPDNLNGSKIAEGQCNKPKAAVDASSSNQRCRDGLNTEAQAHSRCLNASQQRAVPDLVSRGVAEIRNAPVRQNVISGRSGSTGNTQDGVLTNRYNSRPENQKAQVSE